MKLFRSRRNEPVIILKPPLDFHKQAEGDFFVETNFATRGVLGMFWGGFARA